MSTRYWLSAATALSALVTPQIAFAQDQAPQAQSGVFGDIVVTAQRREQNVQDVPLAVTALGEEQLEVLQINQTLDLVNVVPNLFGGNNTGLGSANMYYLRGQGNDESIATFDPPVGTYVDDVYISRQNANNFSFFDVDRIEVLRGPQGTLFGRNTTGGAVNVIMRKPGEEFGGFAEIGYGDYDEIIARATVDAPLGPTLLTKVSAFSIQRDGWLVNPVTGGEYNDKEAWGVRGDLRVLLSDALTLAFAVDYTDDSEANLWGEGDGDTRISRSILPNGVPIVGYQGKSAYGNQTESLNLTGRLSWGFDNGELQFIVGRRQLDQNFLVNFPNAANLAAVSHDFFWIDNAGEHNQSTFEVKWNGEHFDGLLNLTAGLFYMEEDNTTNFADILFGSLILADRVLSNTTETYAAYAQGDINLTDQLVFTVGARYTGEVKELALADNRAGQTLTSARLTAAGIPLEIDAYQVTPRVALQYDYSDAVMFYASATNGFKSGGWNARGTSAASFLPFNIEEIWSYEAGTRADLFNGALRTNLTAFYSDVSGLQTTSATPTGSFLTTNAGSLQNVGVEAEIYWSASPNLDLFTSLGLQNATYEDVDDQIAACVVPNTGFAALDGNCNVAQPKRSPDWTATVGGVFTWPLTDALDLQASTTARFVGPNVVGTRNLGRNESYTLVNAGLSLISGAGWTAALECQNCFDETYVTSYLFGGYLSQPGTWRLNLRYNFGARR